MILMITKEQLQFLMQVFFKTSDMLQSWAGEKIHICLCTKETEGDYYWSSFLLHDNLGHCFGINIGLGDIIQSRYPPDAIAGIMAHEVAHYVLGHGNTGKASTPQDELQADCLATQMLIECNYENPRALIENLEDKCRIHNVSIYKDTFGNHPCTADRKKAMEEVIKYVLSK